MAIRTNNPLGKISGTFGKTVTRIRNGKEVVYVLPGKIKYSKSKAAKAGRKKFGLSVSFAKFVNSVRHSLLSGHLQKFPDLIPTRNLLNITSGLPAGTA